jgi:DNA primase
MIPQSFIQDLLNRVDIVDVVGRYVQLKKGGANYIGLCPFHNEKSPSFTVSPTKQFYHCFGCGAHGTAVSFMMEYSGLGFVEAVKDLAQNVGMVVPEDERGLSPVQQSEAKAKGMALSEAMTRATDYYRQQLRTAPQAIAYLKGRGLTGEVAARFAMGYAPAGWDNLRAVFSDYESSVLVEAGLVIDRAEEGGAPRKRYDRFRDRIMFPIRNTKGQVIAFGGRVMDGGEPKYLNSPETPLFQKGSELYGLFEARLAIRDVGYVLITEGYMDVVALAQLGFQNAVATLGTACTPVHVQKLFRQTDHLVFSFDGDAAGRRAARRALEASLPHMTDDRAVSFLFLPTEHDPDSFIREHGAETFAQRIKDAMPLSQFVLNEASQGNNLDSAEGRARTQFEAKPLLQAMPPSALRLQLVHSLAHMTQTASAEIEALFTLSKPAARVKKAPPRAARTPPVELEKQILRLLIAQPVLANELDEVAVESVCRMAPDGGTLLAQLLQVSKEAGEQASFAVVAEQLRMLNADFDALIAEVAADAAIEVDAARLELAGAIRQTKMKSIKTELEQLFQSGRPPTELAQRYHELMQQQEILRQEALDNAGPR